MANQFIPVDKVVTDSYKDTMLITLGKDNFLLNIVLDIDYEGFYMEHIGTGDKYICSFDSSTFKEYIGWRYVREPNKFAKSLMETALEGNLGMYFVSHTEAIVQFRYKVYCIDVKLNRIIDDPAVGAHKLVERLADVEKALAMLMQDRCSKPEYKNNKIKD